MSCSKEECKCMFSAKQLCRAIELPPALITCFKELDVFFNGCLMTPSYLWGRKGEGDYDLLDGLLVFNFDVTVDDIVNVVYNGSKTVFVRERFGWKLLSEK